MEEEFRLSSVLSDLEEQATVVRMSAIISIPVISFFISAPPLGIKILHNTT
jgi:hypothetical protein